MKTVPGVLDEAAGRKVEMAVVALTMSPCCKTFSRADSSNTERGHHYRLHREGLPLEQATEGRNEREGDGSACCEQDGAAGGGSGDQGACKGSAVLHVQYAQQCHGADNVMENPVGSL